jgi:hypothetical protein
MATPFDDALERQELARAADRYASARGGKAAGSDPAPVRADEEPGFRSHRVRGGRRRADCVQADRRLGEGPRRASLTPRLCSPL